MDGRAWRQVDGPSVALQEGFPYFDLVAAGGDVKHSLSTRPDPPNPDSIDKCVKVRKRSQSRSSRLSETRCDFSMKTYLLSPWVEAGPSVCDEGNDHRVIVWLSNRLAAFAMAVTGIEGVNSVAMQDVVEDLGQSVSAVLDDAG